MNHLKIKSQYSNETYDVALRQSTYLNNRNLYIGLVCKTNYGYEPYCDLTVNLDDTLPKNFAYIDTNNNGNEIMQWLLENKLGKFVGEYGYSGFCAYPLFVFDMNEVKKYLL